LQVPRPPVGRRRQITPSDSFFRKEQKFARQWLYKNGIALPEEDRNPVEIQIEEFFRSVRDGSRPAAGIEVGLNDSIGVILSNLAMDEGRRVYYSEIDRLGKA